MERKLASIQEVLSVNPIPDADNIEVAQVKDWKVVVKKGEFKAGDVCIYCEIDSFLPIREDFEFLRKSSYKKLPCGKEGFRLKTVKLRGQISQGLLLPLSILDIDVVKLCRLTGVELIGSDVTSLLDITKYEAPIPAELEGKVKGEFPPFIPKTDQERIQNLVEL